ncbi:MAG: hypothetical protein AB7F39_06600 [Variibacter sp.]
MLIAGTHAAHIERAARGSRVFWPGVQGPSVIPAGARELSWQSGQACIGVRIAGSGGAAIRPGHKGYRAVPFNCVLLGYSLIADQPGSIVFDIFRSSTGVPGRGDTLCSLAAFRPALAEAQWNEDVVLFGWNTVLKKDDMLGFECVSAATITSVTLTLFLQRPGQP